MRTNTKEQLKEAAGLADDARALMEATANMTGQKVQRARKRLALALEHGKNTGEDLVDASAGTMQELRDRITAALDHGKEIYDEVHDDVISGAKAADHTVRENPYKVMGISLGVGAIIGCLISSRHSRNKE